MAGQRHLILVSYDVTGQKRRSKLAAFLENEMTRVQESLFEGWMTRLQANRLGKRAAAIVGEKGSVRLYIVPRAGVGACLAWGFPPAPCPDGALIV
jgi:CRISPR-associated endonuclease Cas2